MIRTLTFAIPAAVLLVGSLMLSQSASAKPEYSKKEKKSCTFCHTKTGSKELNEAGKYYGEHNHSLEGYKK
jgi:cytochrome c553